MGHFDVAYAGVDYSVIFNPEIYHPSRSDHAVCISVWNSHLWCKYIVLNTKLYNYTYIICEIINMCMSVNCDE